MSVFTNHRIPYAGTPARPFSTLLALFARIVRRCADSPLDNTVLQAVSTHTPATLRAGAFAPVRPHAHWHTVIGDDGRHRLEAHWHPGP
jgi:hypothetical protein